MDYGLYPLAVCTGPPVQKHPLMDVCLLVDVFVCLSAKYASIPVSRRSRRKILEIKETVKDLCKNLVFSIILSCSDYVKEMLPQGAPYKYICPSGL